MLSFVEKVGGINKRIGLFIFLGECKIDCMIERDRDEIVAYNCSKDVSVKITIFIDNKFSG